MKYQISKLIIEISHKEEIIVIIFIQDEAEENLKKDIKHLKSYTYKKLIQILDKHERENIQKCMKILYIQQKS